MTVEKAVESEPTATSAAGAAGATAQGDTFDVVNPATGEVAGTFPIHSADEVRRRVAEAREAQTWWADLGWDGRRRAMRRWMRWLALHCDEVYDIGHRETGRPKADVQFELFAGLEDIRWSSAHASPSPA